MPNYCDNRIGFICDEANTGELEKLYAVLKKICTTHYYCKEGFGNAWLGRVALKHELDFERIPCTGEIYDIWDLDVGATHFIIRTETYWRVTRELWDAVLKQYIGIRYVYISEETSGGEYFNSDVEGICFPEKYFIYANISDSSYDELPPEYFTDRITADELFDETHRFNSFEELQSFMSEITGKTFKTIEDMNSYLQEAMLMFDEDNESLVEIHEYALPSKEG